MPKAVHGSLGGFSEHGLELGESLFDGVEVQCEYGGRKTKSACLASMASRTPLTLWAGRLSITTISPRLRVGARHCSTHALKIVPFMGRSISMDVSMRSWRSAALERALAIKPDFSPAFIDRVIRFRNPDDRAHYLDGLRKAGLPE